MRHDPLIAIGDGRERPDPEPFREMVRLASEGRPLALITVIETVGPVPRGMGTSMVALEDGSGIGSIGGGELERLALEQAVAAIRDGRPRLLRYDFTGGETPELRKKCPSVTGLFVQPFLAGPELLIFGGGHIGSNLARMAQAAGYRVTVLDDRPGLPDPEWFPDGVRLLGGPMVENLDSIKFDDRSTYLVIVSYSHAKDEEILSACLRKPWRYAGMIGSCAKISAVFGKIGADDDTRALLSKVSSPIGLDLGGRSPGEVAVSILAEMQAVRYGKGEVLPMSARQCRREKKQ